MKVYELIHETNESIGAPANLAETEAELSATRREKMGNIHIAARAGELAKRLSILDRFSGPRDTLLGYAMVTADADGKVRAQATDMEMMADLAIDANVQREGVVMVPIKPILAILKNLAKDARVSFSVADQAADRPPLAIEWDHGSSTVGTLPADDFPRMRPTPESFGFSLSAGALLDVVAKISFAISTEEGSYLNGVHLRARDDRLDAVASDGNRLSRKTLPLPEGAENLGGANGITVPRRFVKLLPPLLKAAPNGPERTGVRFGVHGAGTMLSLAVGDDLFVTKLIDGTFPEYDRVIPREEDNERTFSIDGARLLDAVKLVRARMQAVTRNPAIKLRMREGGVDVSAIYEGQTATQRVGGGPVAFRGSEEFEIGFQSAYLVDMLSVAGMGATNWAFSDASGPALVTTPSDRGLTMVLMPTRI